MPQWPYCMPGQLIYFVDRRVLDQILSDTDDNINSTVELANVGGGTYNLALEALKFGSARIDTAVLEANRYPVELLMDLADNPDPPGIGKRPRPDYGVLLRRMTAGLALGQWQDRRVRPSPEYETMRVMVRWAEEFLENVRMGKGIIPGPPPDSDAPADPYASAQGIAVNKDAYEAKRGTFAAGISSALFPARMFGATEDLPYLYQDRLGGSYRDWGGLSGG